MISKDELIDSFFTRHVVDESLVRSELHGIWESGYRDGYETAEGLAKDKYEVDTNMQYNLGYQHGYDNGKDVAYKELSGWTAEEGKAKFDEAYQEGYDKGADDARYVLWWAVSNIILSPDRGGLGGIAVEKIFNTYFLEHIFMNYTPEEVIEKVKDYKEGPKKSAPTNRDKFEEVFGFRPEEHRNSLVIMAENGDLRKIILDKPYEETEHDHS